MTNRLRFHSAHKSITALAEIELPPFVILTGKNGSGKSHLLEAIKNGKVISSIATIPEAEVRLFDWNNIIPKDTGKFDPAKEMTRRSTNFNSIQTVRDRLLPDLTKYIANLGVPGDVAARIAKLGYASRATLIQAIGDESKVSELLPRIEERLKSAGKTIGTNASRQLADKDLQQAVRKLTETTPEAFLTNSETQFYEHDPVLWGQVDPFEQAFARIFVTYRELMHSNDRLGRYPPVDQPDRKHLSDVDFLAKFGPPPWDFVNRILQQCNLDFRTDSPPLHEVSPYEPKLTKISKGVEMKFEDLSSGEKVLMSFALCLYNSQESRQEKLFPKLLLLDEVDAPLHPSMTRSLLDTIQNVLVNEKNVAVIMATHSPSTVAMAPESAVYVMDSTKLGLQKTPKSRAIACLTAGVPTLGISFNGRRQVFVESHADAQIYDSVYQLCKARLDDERSLAFLEVGNRSPEGVEKNAGCAQVKRIVKMLSDGGNQSVLGLIDWDGENTPSNRIHVLSHGKRNGLENLLLDPVLVIALSTKLTLQQAKKYRVIREQDTFVTLISKECKEWQESVQALAGLIIDNQQQLNKMVQVEYLSGLKLQIPEAYLTMDDHDLEKRLVSKLPFLNPYTKRSGDLMLKVVDGVLSEHNELLPKEFIDVFHNLLNTNLDGL